MQCNTKLYNLVTLIKHCVHLCRIKQWWIKSPLFAQVPPKHPEAHNWKFLDPKLGNNAYMLILQALIMHLYVAVSAVFYANYIAFPEEKQTRPHCCELLSFLE